MAEEIDLIYQRYNYKELRKIAEEYSKSVEANEGMPIYFDEWFESNYLNKNYETKTNTHRD